MNKSELQLTSVKVHRDLFEEFKIECVKTKFSFQKLSDRAIYLYLTNEEFKKTIHNQTNLQLNKVINERRLFTVYKEKNDTISL